MSDPTKLPFDPVPLSGGAASATLDPPRPSFSRSTLDMPAGGGLLPPTRKPLAVEPAPVPLSVLPPGIAAEDASPVEPNPLPGSAPPRSGVRGLLRDVFRPTRAKAAILAGVASLAAGAYGLNLLMPVSSKPEKADAKKPQPFADTTTPPAASTELAAATPQDAPRPLPSLTPPPAMSIPDATGGTLPAVQVERPKSTFGGPTVSEHRDSPAPAAIPPSGTFRQVGATEPMPLPALPDVNEKLKPPPAGGALPTVPLPDVALPTSSEPVVKPVIKPSEPGALPPVSLTDTPPKPTPAPLPTVKLDPLPDAPSSNPFKDKDAAIPPAPKPDPLPKLQPAPTPPSASVAVVPVKPLPDPTLPAAPPTTNPFTEKAAPVEPFTPGTPLPGAGPAAVVPVVRPQDLTRPEAKAIPTATPLSAPKGDYEVDIHRVKAGDSYAAISEKYYGSRQYAAALRAANQGADLTRVRDVEVPPVGVIRKQADAVGREADAVTPVGGTGEAKPSDEQPEWGPPGAQRRTETRFERYVVPRDGMTFRDVAKEVYGSEREWSRVDNARNVQFRPEDALRRGDVLLVPVDEPRWR